MNALFGCFQTKFVASISALLVFLIQFSVFCLTDMAFRREKDDKLSKPVEI